MSDVSDDVRAWTQLLGSGPWGVNVLQGLDSNRWIAVAQLITKLPRMTLSVLVTLSRMGHCSDLRSTVSL